MNHESRRPVLTEYQKPYLASYRELTEAGQDPVKILLPLGLRRIEPDRQFVVVDVYPIGPVAVSVESQTAGFRDFEYLASCRNHDTEIFFSLDQNDDRAVHICFNCPVQLECLEKALNTHEIYGIWGGLSYSDRLRVDIARQEARRSPQADRNPA